VDAGEALSPAPRGRATPLNALAKRYTPAELEAKTRTMTDANRRAAIRQAMLYRDLENEELLGPTVERAWNKLQDYATAPAGRSPSVSRLRGALAGLVEAGVLSNPEAEGIVTTYREGWDRQAQMQSADLSASIAGRVYRQAQTVALLAEVETLNAESDPVENGLSEEQERYYAALREAHAENIAALIHEAELSGCGLPPDGLNVDPSAVIRSEVCAFYAAQIAQERQKLVDLGNTLTLGRVDAARHVCELASREAAGTATPQEKQELLTYSSAMGDDAMTSILASRTKGQQTGPKRQRAQR